MLAGNSAADDMKEPDLFERPERLADMPRARSISRLEAYFRGNQYDGRPDWFEGLDASGEPVPLRERKPCIIYDLPKAAVNQAVRFSVGEGRFPQIAVDVVEPDEAVAEGLAVSKDDADAMTKLIDELVSNVGLRPATRTAMRTGLSQKTAVDILSVRRGKFAIEKPRPQDCYAKFVDDDPTADVERLVWCYRFMKLVEKEGALIEEPFLFRRDVTATEYVTYKDAHVEVGKRPEWTVSSATPHGFGFCPVLWTRNQPETHCNDIDGVSMYGDQLDEFDALNFSLSQRHRGVHYFGTPQAYETNVGTDETPAAAGRTARGKREEDPIQGGAFGVTPKKARKAAPDQIWSYQGEAELGVLETSGKAFEVATKHVLDIRARVLESLNVVLMDPETAMKQDLAGVALERLFSPMLAMVDELREYWWEHYIIKAISMMLRIIAVTGGKGLLIPGAKKLAGKLARFELKHERGTVWCPPKMTPAWGDYFSPGPDDILKGVDAAEKAKTAGFITGHTGTRYVSPYFGVEDPEAEAEEAEEEGLEAAARALDEARAKAPVAAGGAEDKPSDEPPSGAAKPKAPKRQAGTREAQSRPVRRGAARKRQQEQVAA